MKSGMTKSRKPGKKLSRPSSSTSSETFAITVERQGITRGIAELRKDPAKEKEKTKAVEKAFRQGVKGSRGRGSNNTERKEHKRGNHKRKERAKVVAQLMVLAGIVVERTSRPTALQERPAREDPVEQFDLCVA